jgi:hypothetical protein
MPIIIIVIISAAYRFKKPGIPLTVIIFNSSKVLLHSVAHFRPAYRRLAF